MNWIIAAIIALIVIIIGCVVVKVILHRKLQDIDGFGGGHKQDQTINEENTIGYFGDEQ